MMSEWRWRIFLAGQVSAFDAAKVTALAETWSLNGSGETTADERKAFTNGRSLALVATPTIEFARGANSAAKTGMRNAFLGFNAAQGLTPNEFRYYVTTAFAQRVAGSDLARSILIATNSPTIAHDPVTFLVDFVSDPTVFTGQDALADAGLVPLEIIGAQALATEDNMGVGTEANKGIGVE